MRRHVTLLAVFAAGALLRYETHGQQQWILDAMNDELQRAVTTLKIDTLAPPYYVAYTVSDGESHIVRATMGALVASSEVPRFRLLNVQVRVGSYAFDNGNFLSFGSGGGSGIMYVGDDGGASTSCENDYASLRRDLWLATDIVYKRALADLSKKQAALQNNVRTDTTADFTQGQPLSIVRAPSPEAFDRTLWEQKARRLSAVLRKYPEIQSSEAMVSSNYGYDYFLNSEGARNARENPRIWVEAVATTQALDGMPLVNAVGFYGNRSGDLPPESEMVRQIETMAEELLALRQTPLLDSYSGPVVFEGQAAAELVAQGLGANLCNIREPVTETAQMGHMIRNALGELPFQNKINARVLPEFLSIVDDPTRVSYKGVPLIASYEVDDEGVQARPVTLVEKGLLKTLLTSRTPHKQVRKSNGHARGHPSLAYFTNVFVSSVNRTKDAELKKQLIGICKERSLDFGIIIRKISNPYLINRLRDRADRYSASFSFGSGTTRPLVSNPLLVYRVFPDGREDLVRGLEFSGLTAQAFKEIRASSQSEVVYNHITMQRKPTMSGLYNPSPRRVCVVTPSLLFDSIDLKRITAPHRTPPIVSHPVYNK